MILLDVLLISALFAFWAWLQYRGIKKLQKSIAENGDYVIFGKVINMSLNL
jgi:hypothetical protein